MNDTDSINNLYQVIQEQSGEHQYNNNMSLYRSYPTPDEALNAAQKYVAANGPIEFSGMNCNDYLEEGDVECDGWDGEDRRCNCGNRRVIWSIEKNPNGTFYAVAEAW